MTLVNLKCPNCGGSIQMDDARITGFCMYCGAKYQVQEEIRRILVQHSGAVELSRKNEVSNLLVRAEDKVNSLLPNYNLTLEEFQEQANTIEANYFERILDIDVHNQKLKEIKDRLDREIENRLLIEEKEIERAERIEMLKKIFKGIGIGIVIILMIFPFGFFMEQGESGLGGFILTAVVGVIVIALIARIKTDTQD